MVNRGGDGSSYSRWRETPGGFFAFIAELFGECGKYGELLAFRHRQMSTNNRC